MPDLYVIVHEEAVRDYLREGFFTMDFFTLFSAARALWEIRRIKSKQKFISYAGDSLKLPEGLPLPSDGLSVLLAGACRRICVQRQYEAFAAAGYNVRFYGRGCLDTGVNN